MADAPGKPVPHPRGEEALFFEAAREHRLEHQRCGQCGRTANYPRALCPHCGSTDVAMHPSSGRGTVHSWTTQLRPGGPGFGDAPYTVVLVDLEEGFRALGDLVGVEDDEVVVGLPVEVLFDDVADDLTLPRFRRTTEDDA